MTIQKDLKRRIRARQAKTGESYTTARMHILKARNSPTPKATPGGQRRTAIVLKSNKRSLRIQIPGEAGTITLRFSTCPIPEPVPGQFIECTEAKRWTWRGDAYASGAIERSWIDIPALGLEPLPLEDQGEEVFEETYKPFKPPDPYAEMWAFFASTPRRAWEFDGIAWGDGVGVDSDEPDRHLIAEAAERLRHEPEAARKLLNKALMADLRCIDAHAHLGNLVFDHSPEEAVTHYEIAAAIGELSLGPNFDGLLPWGHVYNRPYLRALHGYGLCLWRLGQNEEAREVFERILALNPTDNQGIRFCWNDIRNGKEWTLEGDDQPH